MINRYAHNDLIWIDLESPTQEEIREIMEEFSVDPLVAEELLSPSLKPKVDVYENLIYLILHFPAFKHTHGPSANQEVDFVIGKNFIITTRYDTIDPLHKFSKMFEVNSILDRSDMGEHAGYVFFYMVKKLYAAVLHELEYIASDMKEIEQRIFNGMEKEMVFEISKISRELLNFKRALAVHKDVLASFESAGAAFFGPEFEKHLKTLTGEYFRVYDTVGSHIDSVTELRETNNSMVSTKQNEIMKILTIMAFVTFPLSLVAAIFGMNTHTLPVVGQPNDFWIIIGGMLSGTALFFAYFKYKKWM